MQVEFGFDSKLRQLHFFNLDDWGAVYSALPAEEFVEYQVANPGIFKLDRLNGWPRIKRATPVKSFSFGVTDNTQRSARIVAVELWVFPFDIAAVSIELQYRGTMTGLRNFSLEVKTSGELREYSERLAHSQFPACGCQLLGKEDTQYIQIHQSVKESILEDRYEDITAILTGEDEQFSDQYMEEILEDTVPYTRNAYALIGSRCLIQVHAKIDDLFCLWMLQAAYAKKIQRVERMLDSRLQQTYQLLSRPRRFLPVPSFSHRALQDVKLYDRKTLQIVDRFLTPIEIVGTGFFSLANETITSVLDISAWQTTIKEKYDDLEDSYEQLENTYSMKNQELVEWLIILVIVFSALATVMVELNPNIRGAASGWWHMIEVSPQIWTAISDWWQAALGSMHPIHPLHPLPARE
jgi:hypothetical protein